MAGKYRPKGSYKDYLSIMASDLGEMNIKEVISIVSKLNDAANKRLNRLEENRIDNLSPSYRSRQGRRFTISRKATMKEAKAAYLSVKGFLENKTSDLKGARAHIAHMEKVNAGLYERVLGAPLDDPSNLDRRYKNKKVLKKSTHKKLSKFWEKYNQWKEIQQNKNPDKQKGGTNKDSVEYFYNEIWSKNKTSYKAMEKAAKEQYEEEETEHYEEDNNDYDDLPIEEGQDKPVQPPKPKRGGKKSAKQKKHKGKGKVTIKYWEPKIEFESINILDYVPKKK